MPNLWFKLYGDSKPFEESLARAQRAATTVGGQIGKKFEFKDLGRTLATSLGFSLEKIAEKAARVFTGMSEEVEAANKTIAEATTKHADYVIDKMRETLDLEKQYQLLLKERDKILKNAPKSAGEQDFFSEQTDTLLAVISTLDIPGLSKAARNSFNQRKEARQAPVQAAQAEAQVQADEKEKKAAEVKAKLDEKRAKLAQMRRDNQLGELSLMGKFNAVSDELESLEKTRAALAAKKADTTDVELQIEQKISEQQKIQNQLAQEGAEDNRKAVELEEKRKRLMMERADAEKDLAKDRNQLSDAQSDRGRLSLGELANVGAFSFGADKAVVDDSSKARDVQELLRKANEARSGGRIDEANSLFSQADQTRAGLTSLKSDERDPFKAYKDALKDSEEKLQKIVENSAKLPTNL